MEWGAARGLRGERGGGRPGAPCEEHGVFRVKESRAAPDGAIWVVPRVSPSHEGGGSPFFLRGAGPKICEDKETVYQCSGQD